MQYDIITYVIDEYTIFAGPTVLLYYVSTADFQLIHSLFWSRVVLMFSEMCTLSLKSLITTRHTWLPLLFSFFFLRFSVVKHK